MHFSDKLIIFVVFIFNFFLSLVIPVAEVTSHSIVVHFLKCAKFQFVNNDDNNNNSNNNNNSQENR